MLYGSYEEKIHDLASEIFGLQIVQSRDYKRYLPDVAEEDREEYAIYRLRVVTSASVNNDNIRISVKKDSGTGEAEEVQVVQEGSEAYVILSSHEHGELYIEAELKGEAESVRWNGIQY